jgi:hypothetical protein
MSSGSPTANRTGCTSSAATARRRKARTRPLDTKPTLHAKFYTIHLADPAISGEAKDAIQRASGLKFTFTDDGRVGWERYADD